MQIRYSALVLPFFLILGGCRPCLTPTICLPESFIEGEPALRCGEGEPASLATWWEQFEDPLLTYFIEEALNCNHDLRIARERVIEARALYRLQFSKVLPQLDLVGQASRSRNSETLLDASVLASPGLVTETPAAEGTFTNLFTVGFDATWEIDFFGKNRDLARGAWLDAAATAVTVRDVHVTVAAEVATTYLRVRGLQEQIRVTKKAIENEQNLVSIAESRYSAGLVTALDIYTASGLLEERKSELYSLEESLKINVYALSVLLGKVPELLHDLICEPGEIPCADKKIPLCLPSELLCRRGDVRNAEFTMLASGARVLAARKEFLPTISLSGFYGYATSSFGKLFNPASRTWTIGSAFLLPIFHGGAILANIDAQTSKQRQAAIAYEQSIINALKEVESSLAAYFEQGQRIQTLEKEVSNYRTARELAEGLYVDGIVDFTTVVQNARDLYRAEVLFVLSRTDLMRDLVAIYKALGGGWECYYTP